MRTSLQDNKQGNKHTTHTKTYEQNQIPLKGTMIINVHLRWGSIIHKLQLLSKINKIKNSTSKSN